jgi:DNA gyrase subunit A
MDAGDEVVSLEVLPVDEGRDKFSILTVTRRGMGKRTAIDDYRLTGRGGKGVINMNVTEKTGEVVSSRSVLEDDNVIITTVKGIVIRTPLKNVRVMGRATQGVRIINLASGDRVSDLSRVPTDENIE